MHDIDPPKIHDLEELEKLCETINPQFKTLYEKCAILTEYAVHTRYPDEKQLDKHDTDSALEYARSIREFIRSQFPELESTSQSC